ncbi:TBC1 domain family member 30-like isoform X2 [Mercenaria mercenaria]|uniref:TBC1 domain family member 30-like isoform X2 n=1 Tax=Mercenaria mercenaria TaxID=6596 RepID=UPI00234F68C6|nr:TBC1 domain family member 30-like isoform X2 [Mercenaria mercenaria]
MEELSNLGLKDLKNLLVEISRHVSQMSARLVRQLKRRERRMSKLQNNCDIVTAIIQASSPKRRIDTRMKFSVEPSSGDSAFEQWKDAMKAVARLPLGIPAEFRKKVWLSLAEQHIKEMKIDWDKTVRFAFNERSNPDDNKLGLQIVKDLHRTGCSGFSGEDNEEERALLKRILLAYARWNKVVGYCQGFNMIAALLLEVMDRKESDALKVMIYLIDHVLPQGYFANNLRALSVDMAVFRDLLKIFPKLSRHLDYLQHAQDQTSGGCYEPPLTNVFTMQWFLTLFATCLPKSTVLRVWDSILLDGSEILLRTALVIWGKLSSRILTVSSADEFYTLMGDITQEMLEGNILDADSMIKSIYCIAPFPLPQLTELREKYTYNIRPFTPSSKKASWPEGTVLPSDEDDLEDEDLENITCFTGFIPTNVSSSVKHHKGLEGNQRTGSLPDISSLGPGAYGMGPADGSGVPNIPAYMERMSTDISALKKQYTKLRQRQNQAHIILTSASARHQAMKSKPMMPKIETPTAMNHLFLNKQNIKGRNRFIAEGPRIANVYPVFEPQALNKQSKKSKNKALQSNGEKQKWNQKMKTEKNIEEKASCSNGQLQIKTSATAAADNELHKNTNNSSSVDVTENIPKQESEDSTKCDNIKEHGAETSDDPSIAESKSSGKCVQRVLQHKDSGLGYSVSSPLFSGSSTESSPQHSSYSSVESSCRSKCDEADASEHLKGEEIQSVGTSDIVDSNLSENYDNHISDLSNLVKEICDAQCNDWPTDKQEMDSKICRNVEEYNEREKNIADCENYTNEDKVGGKSDVDITDVISDDYNKGNHIVVEGYGDSSRNNAADDVEADSAGATGDNTKVGEINKGANDLKGNTTLEIPCQVDIEVSESDTNEAASDCIGMASDAMNISRPEIKGNKELTNQKQDLTLNSSNSSPQLCSSDKSPYRSAGKSDSSNSVVSIHSGDDTEIFPEVFSPTTSSGQASFQQYYINKRNLSSESPKGLDAQLKKTQMPKKVFNPFPVKHMNQNRAKTGIKLGLYTPSTLQEYERSLKGQPLWGK